MTLQVAQADGHIDYGFLRAAFNRGTAPLETQDTFPVCTLPTSKLSSNCLHVLSPVRASLITIPVSAHCDSEGAASQVASLPAAR